MGLDVQSPSFKQVCRTVGRRGAMGSTTIDTLRGCGTYIVVRMMRAAATDTCEGATATLARMTKGLAVETPPRTRRERAHRKAFEAHEDMRRWVGHTES